MRGAVGRQTWKRALLILAKPLLILIVVFFVSDEFVRPVYPFVAELGAPITPIYVSVVNPSVDIDTGRGVSDGGSEPTNIKQWYAKTLRLVSIDHRFCEYWTHQPLLDDVLVVASKKILRKPLVVLGGMPVAESTHLVSRCLPEIFHIQSDAIHGKGSGDGVVGRSVLIVPKLRALHRDRGDTGVSPQLAALGISHGEDGLAQVVGLGSSDRNQAKGERGKGGSERGDGVCPEFLNPGPYILGVSAAVFALGLYMQGVARRRAYLWTLCAILGWAGYFSTLLGDWWSPLICWLR